MRQFDLEAAKRGEPIVTRDGRPAKFIAHVPGALLDSRIVVLITESGDVLFFHEDGKRYNESREASNSDIFMAPRKVVKWAVVHVHPEHGPTWSTDPSEREEWAREVSSQSSGRHVARVEWEE